MINFIKKAWRGEEDFWKVVIVFLILVAVFVFVYSSLYGFRLNTFNQVYIPPVFFPISFLIAPFSYFVIRNRNNTTALILKNVVFFVLVILFTFSFFFFYFSIFFIVLVLTLNAFDLSSSNLIVITNLSFAFSIISSLTTIYYFFKKS